MVATYSFVAWSPDSVTGESLWIPIRGIIVDSHQGELSSILIRGPIILQAHEGAHHLGLLFTLGETDLVSAAFAGLSRSTISGNS